MTNQTMSDFARATARGPGATTVWAGALYVVLVERYGLFLGPGGKPDEATFLLVNAVAFAALTLVRIIEIRWPKIGVLLLSPNRAHYGPVNPEPEVEVEAEPEVEVEAEPPLDVETPGRPHPDPTAALGAALNHDDNDYLDGHQ